LESEARPAQMSLFMQYANLLKFQRKFTDFRGVFQSARWKTQTNNYIPCKNSIWTFHSHAMSKIWPRPHTEKSLCNQRLKLALQRLLSNPHKRSLCFSQGQLSSTTEKRTNTEWQILLLLTLFSSIRRYDFDHWHQSVFAMIFFPIFFRPIFGQGEREIRFLKYSRN